MNNTNNVIHPDFWFEFRDVFNEYEVLAGDCGEHLYCEREYSPYASGAF